jgi:hypothetical protein
VIDLHNRLKARIIGLTRSQYAVPLLDRLFEQPVFPGSQFDHRPGMPSKTMVLNLLARLKNAGILKVVREGSGRRPQILALTELVNICEGAEII